MIKLLRLLLLRLERLLFFDVGIDGSLEEVVFSKGKGKGKGVGVDVNVLASPVTITSGALRLRIEESEIKEESRFSTMESPLPLDINIISGSLNRSAMSYQDINAVFSSGLPIVSHSKRK